MLSIRTRFSLAMVVTSFIAIALVGAIAMSIILNRFNNLVMERAFTNFSSDVTAFVTKHGSWQAGQANESFRDFTMARNKLPENLPKPGKGQIIPPPFRFILLDNKGIILRGPDRFTSGTPLPEEFQHLQKPIIVNGEVAVIAVPMGEPNLSDLDKSYLDAITTALKISLVVAGSFATLLGIIFGNRISRSLIKLTTAIQAMKPGKLHQQVDIKTNDEVGVLGNAFNNMNTELSNAYQELEESHRTITEQADKLKELAIRDELTGLYNRRFFNERTASLFEQAKRYDRPFSIMIGDIDLFKNINDKFGHGGGDEVLKVISKIISEHVRSTDIAARYGGEEFVIVFPETDLEHAYSLCERLRGLIENFNWEAIEKGLSVTISMGLSADMTKDSFEEVLDYADSRLYSAKESGRNRVMM